MKQELQIKDGYGRLLENVKGRIRQARYEALRTVNKELISLYWDIGAMIISRQEGRSWGKSVVKKLAEDLQKEFPGIRGFSTQNLWYMRQFYLSYENDQKLQPLVGEISWSKNLVIMSKCKGDLEREFYIRVTRKFGWTKSVLIHQIENMSYEKTLLGQTNFAGTLPDEILNQAKLVVKDEYTFDFLELGEEHSERQLEKRLISKVELFLQEMGNLFCFVGSQFRLEVSSREFFIDILLYHRRLRSLVAVDLKIGDFQPEYIGKMQFYLSALDDMVRLEGENPSLGIILCRSRDKTIVEYALRDSGKPIGVAGYRMVRILPEELAGELPTPEQIMKLLEEI